MRGAATWALALSLALVGGCRTRVAFQGARATVSRPHAPALAAGWTDVRPENAGIACQMPLRPEIVAANGFDDDGSRYQTVTMRATLPYGTFSAIATQWEGGVVGDPIGRAREIADSIVQLAEATDRRASRVSIPGFYAREDRGHTSDGAFFALRQFVGRDRLYVAVVAVRDDPVGLAAAEHFMRSIELDRRDASLPSGESTQPVPLYLPDVDFAVNMPPLARRRSYEVAVADTTVDVVVFESQHASGVYRVTVVQYPGAPPEGALDAVATTFSLGEAREYVHASGFPGRTFAPESDQVARAYLTMQRVYVVQITGAAGLSPVATDGFFDSFRIL